MKALLIGGLLFAASVALPFLPKAIHFLPYIQNILLTPRQGIDFESMSTSLAYGALILLFPVTSYRSQKSSPENRILILSMVFSMSVVALLSGKPGGGAIYMMPFVPMAIYCGLRFQYSGHPVSVQGPAKVPNWLFACVLICASPIWLYSLYEMSVQLLEGKREFAKRAELRKRFSAFPHAEMGRGDGPRDSADEYYRAQRAFLGQSTRFDYVNYADQRMAGAGLAPMHSLLTGCKVPAWIFARSCGHFTGKAYGVVELFDDEVRNLFGSDYQLTRIGNFYEVWTCQ